MCLTSRASQHSRRLKRKRSTAMTSVEKCIAILEIQCQEMTNKELLEVRNWLDRKMQTGNSAPEEEHCSSSTWVNGETLCKIFRCLSFNNVKNRKWRIDNRFPCFQDGPCAQVSYNTEEVKAWIDQRIKGIQAPKC